MSSHRILRNGVVVAVLIALLAAAGAPAQARPLRPAVERTSHVAGFGERLWHFLMSLWTRDLRKEGTSIDPDGGDKPNEGMTIDPDGRS
ncbi:MAG: hypothetical protein QOF89_939 [Acidobacteriota bacterium]|jgi:hypothetical protein|nr:hypothetical protein [Acidobacteriota bacterium]